MTAGDLWTAVDQGIHTGAAYHMTVFHRLLCGGRGVLFAAVSRSTKSFGARLTPALPVCGSMLVPRASVPA
jgi:hypothetical protein